MLSNITILMIVSGCAWLVMLIYLSVRNSSRTQEFIAPGTSYFFNGSQIGQVKVPRRIPNCNELSLAFTVSNLRSAGTLASVKLTEDYYTLEVDKKNALTLFVKQPVGPQTPLVILDDLHVQNAINVSLTFQYSPDEDDTDQFKITLEANGKAKEILIANKFRAPKKIYLANSDRAGPKKPFRGVIRNIHINHVPITGGKMRILS
jgi:hypothetical protein